MDVIQWAWYGFSYLVRADLYRWTETSCLRMLMELINKGSVPYCGSNDNNLTGVSLSEIVFSFMLEKYIGN